MEPLTEDTEFGTILGVTVPHDWSYDSRNRSLFANRGIRQQVFLGITIPGSDVEYYTARYNFTMYQPIYGRWVARINAELG